MTVHWMSTKKISLRCNYTQIVNMHDLQVAKRNILLWTHNLYGSRQLYLVHRVLVKDCWVLDSSVPDHSFVWYFFYCIFIPQNTYNNTWRWWEWMTVSRSPITHWQVTHCRIHVIRCPIQFCTRKWIQIIQSTLAEH